MVNWRAVQKELPEHIRVWLYEILELSDDEMRCQINTYLVEHNANLMESLDRMRESNKDKALLRGGLG